ncbi:DUF2167 domain-containing protein [Methylopila sp. M107]|uniref:DUF2167 domain-containing protein n=1 Tax=Methylopila sp. M107 TaxID=1101190 RepID=UPI00036E86D4|nr:DUF2167 domain-containing protein [Methylopila sp. M107]
MKRILQGFALAGALAATHPAQAQTPAPPPAQTAQSVAEARDAELKAAFQAANGVAKHGPATIALSGQGTMELPAGFALVPQPEAGRVMRAQGNSASPDLAALVYPTGEGGWFASIRYVAAGYIRDDDAKDWNADELLENLRAGTEESNELRVAKGIPPIEVRRWIEKPAYDAESHRLVWSALAVDKGAADADGAVNYNTYALGREGYFSLNFITGQAEIDNEKAIARKLLNAIKYDAGKAYGDFNAGTDRVAEFGLAALIGGVAAKKLGLFALIGAFVLKFAKFFLLGGALLFGGLFKLFRRGSAAE